MTLDKIDESNGDEQIIIFKPKKSFGMHLL